MKKEDVLQSKVIDFLRFPMIVGIVLLHAFLGSIKGLEVPNTGLTIYHTISFFISRVLVSVAVPLYFFISGYLFFYRTSFSISVYKKKLKSRAMSLLVPYIFWNLVILAAHWGVTLLFSTEMMSGAYKLVKYYTILDYLRSFWNINGSMPINGVLWFIRDLMVMVVCSPLVYLAIRYLRWYILFILGCIWMTGYTLAIPQMSAIFFFTLGAWFSINNRNLIVDFKPFFPIGVIFYLIYAIGIVGTERTGGYTYVINASILMGIVAVIALTTHFIENGKWKSSIFLTGSCFLVYAFHQLTLNFYDRVLFRIFHPVSDWQFLLIYFSGPILIITLDLLIYAWLKKCFPRFTAVITGGRS